jgi:hypothetical protein
MLAKQLFLNNPVLKDWQAAGSKNSNTPETLAYNLNAIWLKKL